MFIHASDPDRIKKELDLLASQLHELTRQVHLLSNNLVTTTPRGKQTLPALFIREVIAKWLGAFPKPTPSKMRVMLWK